MAKIKTPTFPVIKGTNVRRNAETGIEIHNDGDDGYAVMIPRRLASAYLFATTLAEARKEAIREVEYYREILAEAREQAAACLAADIEATVAECGPLNFEVLRQTLAAARRSVEAGFLGAAARRLNRAHNMINGTEHLPTDEEVAEQLAAAKRALPVGTTVADPYLKRSVTVDRAPFIDAETGRICVGVKASTRRSYAYIIRYMDELTDADTAPDGAKFTPIKIGTGMVWRNAETGVEIAKFPGQAFVVGVPVNQKHVEVFQTVLDADTFAEAHDQACEEVYSMRSEIGQAYEEALKVNEWIDDNADRCVTPAPAEGSWRAEAMPTAADTDAAIAAEVAEANGQCVACGSDDIDEDDEAGTRCLNCGYIHPRN